MDTAQRFQRSRRFLHPYRDVFLATIILLGLTALLATAAPRMSHAQTTLGPCDIYAGSGTPCVAAHSMTRALYADYDGPLYQVQRSSDGMAHSISPVDPGGYANAAAQDAFCHNTSCIITRIYDQSPNHNDLTIEGPGGNGGANVGAPANALPVTVGGQQVYGLEISAGMGYRNDTTVGVAKNGQPETMYMVASGTHANNQCCFDYGNAEANNKDNGAGHMDALSLSTVCGQNMPCQGSGPWVRADMENGLFPLTTQLNLGPGKGLGTTPFVTALLKNNGQTAYAIEAGNAQIGGLTISFVGNEPSGYSPMHQEGAIVLGTGGDDSNKAIGSFFEGVMIAGISSQEADNAVQANIVSAGYGGSTGLSGVLAPNSEVSLRAASPCCSSSYLAHSGTASNQVTVQDVTAASNPVLFPSATWIIRKGLSNSGCVSFEARTYPGDYLRQYNFAFFRAPDDGTAQFAEDSTFCPQAAADGTMFLSAYISGALIRNFNLAGYLAIPGGSNAWDTPIGFSNDTTWIVSPPLAP